jgi:hypothetical protein
MNNHTAFFTQIRDLIARDEIDAALQQLRALLDNSPKLDEILLQSARFQGIRKQIRLGLVSHAEANLTQNQIRAGLLDLLSEMEENIGRASNPSDVENTALRAELDRAISIVHSKNVVIGSTISAGGNVTIGDTTTHTESQTSRRLRWFSWIFVPILALAGAFFWFQWQKMKTPLALTVALDNRTPNPELPFEGGSVSLEMDGKTETLPIQSEADFKNIPPHFRGEGLRLRFEAAGFVKIDTAFRFDGPRLTLPIRRDASLARVFGTVRDGQGLPLAGAQVRVQDMSTESRADGSFSLDIPFSKQRKKQRLSVFLSGYAAWEFEQPVLENEAIPIILQSK